VNEAAQDGEHEERMSDEEMVHRLRAARLRVTQPRLMVLHVLNHKNRHLSADDILAELRAHQASLPRASVYNILGTFVVCGIASVTDAGPGRTLYEIAGRWHHHFVCRECGRIIDVPCVVGESPCLVPDEIDAEVDTAQVIFRGRCRTCIDAEKSAAPPHTVHGHGTAR